MNYPVMLPAAHVQRLLDHAASVLILPRALPVRKDGHPSLFEVHNATTHRVNLRQCLKGMPEKQENPSVFVMEVLQVDELTLRTVGLEMARVAGYGTWSELRNDWQLRYRVHGFDVDMTVHAHQFKIVEARFLHEQLHKNYAFDPMAGALGEPEVISEAAANTMAVANRQKFETERAEEFRHRTARSINTRLKSAIKRSDANAIRDLRVELEAVEAQIRSAA